MKLNRIPKPILIATFIVIALAALWHFGSKREIPKRITGKDDTPMVLIPAGEFQMGSNDGEDDEKPVHTVHVDAFYMDIYEVTNAQHVKFCDLTGRGVQGHWGPGTPDMVFPISRLWAWHGRQRWSIANGRESGCPPKRSGREPREADWKGRNTLGVMNPLTKPRQTLTTISDTQHP